MAKRKGKHHSAPRHGNRQAGGYTARLNSGVDYLIQRAFLQGYVKACDLLALALHDPEVLGRGGTMGADRIMKVYEGMDKYALKYNGAWDTGKEADYLQDKLDAELLAIFGRKYSDQFSPFKVRHDLVDQLDYNKPHKEWK